MNQKANKPQRNKPPQRNTTHKSNLTKEVLQKELGTLISWEFNGKSWTTDLLKSLAIVCKLPITIKDIPISNGMHNAVGVWKSKSGNGYVVAKKVHMDADVYTFGILEIAIDVNGKKAKGHQIDSISYDTINKSFLSRGTTDYADSLCRSIEHRITHYTGNEFRKWIIMNWLEKCNAIRVMGGGYFISSQFDKEIDALAEFCKTCGVTLHLLDQSPNKRTKEGLSTKAQKSIFETVEELKAKFEVYKKRKRVRSDGRDGMQKEINGMKKRTEFLKEILSANVDDINQVIGSLQSELDNLNASQPKGTQTSNKVLQVWKNAMNEKFQLKKDGKVTGYRIAFTEFEALLIPKTATNKFYWKPDQRLGLALAELGFKGKLLRTSLILEPITKG